MKRKKYLRKSEIGLLKEKQRNLKKFHKQVTFYKKAIRCYVYTTGITSLATEWDATYKDVNVMWLEQYPIDRELSRGIWTKYEEKNNIC